MRGGGWRLAKVYTTKSGDTWDLIAYEQMGDCRYMGLLMDANRVHVRTAIFSAGVELTIPPTPKDVRAKTLPPWKR